MSDSNGGFQAPFNVVAAFAQEDDASVAVDALATRGVPLLAITMHRPEEEETADEVVELEAGRPCRSTPATAGALSAFALGLLGTVLGLWAGLTWGYVVTLGAIAGLAGGAIGRRWQRLGWEEPEVLQLAAERDVVLALHVCDPELAERTAALLRGLGAERVDLFDAYGNPLAL